MNGDEHKPLESDDAHPLDKRDTADAETDSVDEALAGFEAAEEPTSGGETDPIAELKQQLDEEQQRTLRVQADLENFRKRVRRDMEDERKYAAMPLLRDLLPAIDNLNRAIDSVQPDESAAGLLEGVRMVAQQLETVLQNHHCAQIQAEGELFDPMWHEAIAEQPSADHPRGTVVLVTQTGYRLHDRVVRPSQVIVSKEVEG